MKLLRKNDKTILGESLGYTTVSLMLAPGTSSGYDVCPKAGACAKICMGITGCHHTDSALLPHIRNTIRLFEDGENFLSELHAELKAFAESAVSVVPCIRLNNFSDLDFSGVAWQHVESNLIFYDYTKREDLYKRFLKRQNEDSGDWPSNYHLCFSRSESNWKKCQEYLKVGGTVAVVFRNIPETLPATWEGYPLVDGRVNDLRFRDARGSVIALQATASARKDESGFVVDLCPTKSNMSEKQKVKDNVEYYTPKEIMTQLGIDFQTDPACPTHDHYTATTCYTVDDDGLDPKNEWRGKVFLNPPYLRDKKTMVAWSRRMVEHNNGVCLIRASTDSEMFHIMSSKCSAILLYESRIAFLDENFVQGGQANHPTVFLAFGDECGDALMVSDLPGTCVPMNQSRYVPKPEKA